MTIAIVEVSESHEECIYSQVSFLKNEGHSVNLFIHPKIESQISSYRHLIDDVLIINFETSSLIKRLIQQQKLFNLLKKNDRIIFNTGSSSKTVRNLCLLLKMSKVECIGILHNVKKLEKSFTQKLISYKIKKYFVLSDHLKPTNSIVKIQSFYPIFFPKYKCEENIKKNNIWITIPGRLDYNRRDYDFLFNNIKTLENIDNIKFVLLGKIDPKSDEGKNLYKKLNQLKILNNFILFNDFIDNVTFHNYIKKSDFILPLLIKNKDYLNYKITGSFNLAYAYKKILISNIFFSDIEDLSEHSLFYDKESFNELILKISNGTVSKKEIYKKIKWNYNIQKKQYLGLINN
ncbi:hypothetical protein [Cellulophaga fucicola]|uniref:hypothetical protein n=1 Tax=Cellulophaga fucicola TaxID=76595 RepID=UPI003EBC5EFD